MSDIKVCTFENSGSPGDIVVCNQDQTASPGDIKICEGDSRLVDDECATASELLLSGSTDPIVGDVYVGSGGVAPYSYSITSPGAIGSSSGVISSLTYCQSYTITVTDACGSTASIITAPSYGAPTANSGSKTTTSSWCSTSANFCYVEPYNPFIQTTTPYSDTQFQLNAYSYRNDSDSSTETTGTLVGSVSATAGCLKAFDNFSPYGNDGDIWRWTWDFIERCACP